MLEGIECTEVSVELSSACGVTKELLNRELYKRFSEDLVEVTRVDVSVDVSKLWLRSRVLSRLEIVLLWSWVVEDVEDVADTFAVVSNGSLVGQ